MEKSILRKVFEKLRNYGVDKEDYKSRIVLAAPAHGQKKLLRVYMNGGNIGKIALDNSGKTTGINSRLYSHKYKGEVPQAVEILASKSIVDEDSRLAAIISDEYLRYAQEATTTYSVKSGDMSDKERMVETMIMDFRHQKCGNAAIDMEMQYSVRDHFGWTRTPKDGHNKMEYRKKIWYNEYFFENSSDTKSPRVDLMILNDKGIGFVELKVDNENCDNLSSHINHMKYIVSHKDKFIADAERRIAVLEEYGLLEKEMMTNLDKWKKSKEIWCGILFVGNREHLLGAKQLIEKYENKIGEDIFCSFIGKEVVKPGKLNFSSDLFVIGKEFILESYKGVFLN